MVVDELRLDTFTGVPAIEVSLAGLGNCTARALIYEIQELIPYECWTFDRDQMPLLRGDGGYSNVDQQFLDAEGQATRRFGVIAPVCQI